MSTGFKKQAYADVIRAIRGMGKEGDVQEAQDMADNFANANPERGGAMAGIERLMNQFLMHKGGKRTRRKMDGSIVNADELTGVDWLLANGPDRQSVKDREARLQEEYNKNNANAMADGREAVEAAKQTKGYNDAQGNFVPPTMPVGPQNGGVQEQNGVRIARDASGKTVGFSIPSPSEPRPYEDTMTNREGYAPSGERKKIQQSIADAEKVFYGGGSKPTQNSGGFQIPSSSTQEATVPKKPQVASAPSRPTASAQSVAPGGMDNMVDWNIGNQAQGYGPPPKLRGEGVPFVPPRYTPQGVVSDVASGMLNAIPKVATGLAQVPEKVISGMYNGVFGEGKPFHGMLPTESQIVDFIKRLNAPPEIPAYPAISPNFTYPTYNPRPKISGLVIDPKMATLEQLLK